MPGYIKREAVIAVIEERQKELCPVGRYGREYVYGSDREKYNNWDEILDEIDTIPDANVVPVVKAWWIDTGERNEDGDRRYMCAKCHRYDTHSPNIIVPYCWACGAKMGDTK